MFKQVKFVDSEGSTFGGIASMNEDKIKFIICGCCGGVFEPNDVTIIRIYDDWIDFNETIIGDD